MPQTPPVTKNLIMINAIVYLALIVGQNRGVDLNDMLGLHFLLAPNFNPVQVFTYMFMHANFWHLFCNMFTLWMFGRIVEGSLGSRRFLWFYLLCGIGAGLSQEVVQLVSYYAQGLNNFSMVRTGGYAMPMGQYLSLWTTVGASGACYGVLIAFGMLFPNERVMLLIPPIPLKAKYMVIGFIIIDLLSALGGPGDGVAHFAHLGGALAGWLILRRMLRRRASGFTSWQEYSDRRKWTDRLRDIFRKKPAPPREEADEEEEIDRILEKIKRSGYDSLSQAEKDKLFNNRK
ncbi:MAG: rhomboid family intramembrane serine protease [Bacteroidaceae bacterium]|nr:rhomboid family intramembrane serine protease [Bacteroidaceae bacterium]